MAYKPKRGDALLFFDTTVDYKSIDQFSMHTGCEWDHVNGAMRGRGVLTLCCDSSMSEAL